jgi:PAS domain S-box-containing protein
MVNERVGEHTPDGRAPYLETLARVAATGEPRHFEAFVPVWNRHFDVSAFSPAAGQVAVLFNDITDRKRAEEALRSSEKRFHDLYDTIRDAIVIVDEERKIQDCNPAFTELFGYGPEEVKGKTTRLLFEEEEGFRRLGREMAEQAEKRDFLHTARYLTKGGRSFVGEKHVHYVRDEEGRITGFIGLIRDVTEKHEAQEQINQLLHEKQMILREVHHRIKNDMFSISSLLSLQASSLDSGEAVQALQTAQHRINIMRNLYQTLFTSESFQQVQLDDFLQTIVDNLKESYASYARITLQAEIAQMEVGAKMAFPVGIILNELITNAFKYAFPDGGSGTITAAVQRRGEKSLEIRVEDDGRGLPAEVSEQGSYGFGLTLVDTFTRQHSGELHTEQDGGTRIRALLQMED